MWSEDRSSFRKSEVLRLERNPVLERDEYPLSSELSDWGKLIVSGGHEVVYRVGIARIDDENAGLLYVLFAGVVGEGMDAAGKKRVRGELERILKKHSIDIARKAKCRVISAVKNIPESMYGSLAEYLMGLPPSSF